MPDALVYGAYGYTGELVAREAVDAGLDVGLAGRRADPLLALADGLGVEARVADLEALAEAIGDVDVLLHCAGPFADTAEPAVEACLATGTHYLDVTGEVPVFEALRRIDGRAREAGVMVLPGAGFDVVPSDCLAAQLHERLPGADRLTLAFAGLGGISPGTARTAARMLGEGVPVRQDGELRWLPFGRRTQEIDTGTGYGRQRMSALPWGDVSTAYHTTGIPNIEVYTPRVMGLSPRGQRILAWLQRVLGAAPVQRVLAGLAHRFAEGPDAAERESGSAFFWGEVSDGEETVSGRVHTPETYRLTASSMVEIATRVLEGDASVGYQTPATAYGSDLVLGVDGTRFEAVGSAPPA